MIPRDYITQWRERAPWSEDFQVEQDLVISRALVAVYSDPVLAEALAFRGGAALYKLYLTPPARYSEDIDLVQVEPGPAGPLMGRLRSALDPWLGKARWKHELGAVRERMQVNADDGLERQSHEAREREDAQQPHRAVRALAGQEEQPEVAADGDESCSGAMLMTIARPAVTGLKQVHRTWRARLWRCEWSGAQCDANVLPYPSTLVDRHTACEIVRVEFP